MSRCKIRTLFWKAILHYSTLCWQVVRSSVFAGETASWVIGPFTRPVNQPVIKPTAELVFDCPMRKRPVRWAENHTFNPAAVVYKDRIHVLFRAEDGSGNRIGTYSSRVGDAVSDDGISFKLQPTPILYPAADKWVGHEWYGGCEDPRIVESKDGLFAIYYTMWNPNNPKGVARAANIGVATSLDLKSWTKHGPIFAGKEGQMKHGTPKGHKAAGVVQKIHDGRLVAAKIQGKYWMYWGEHAVRLATSKDLITWTPVLDEKGKVRKLIAPRRGYFDSQLTEVGPPPVLTDQGIVLIYNGKNCQNHGDPTIGPGAYSAGQVLFDKDDPAKVLDRLDKPFLKPELDFEKTGQYKQGTVFAEGLVLFKNKWYLYYGTADTYVGVATAPYKKTEQVKSSVRG